MELIEALLDVSRLQRGALDLDVGDVDLTALIGDVVDRVRATASATDSALALEAPPSLRGRFDASRIDQIVTNLLSNAIKYGRGKPIAVKLVVIEDPAGRRVEISVSDEGIGIAPADQERIFERFERAVSRTHYSGWGWGCGSRGASPAPSAAHSASTATRPAARASRSGCRSSSGQIQSDKRRSRPLISCRSAVNEGASGVASSYSGSSPRTMRRLDCSIAK